MTKTGFQSTDMPMGDQQGNVILKVEDKLRCWKEHFERVLNRDDLETEAIITPSSELLDIDTDAPNVEEVKRAIKALKDEKTPGIDQAPVVQRLDNAIHRINHYPVDEC